MKICSKCKHELNENQFAFKSKKKGKLQSWCRSCQKIGSSENYQRHKPRYIQEARRRNEQERERKHRYVIEYLQSHSCVDCGENDPVVLEFDHRDPSLKVAPVGALIGQGASLEKVKIEIDKCDVRCANCHRRKTSQERGWFKFVLTHV